MSLHLIESREPQSSAIARRPWGNAASVTLHAALIAGAILATSSPPSFANDRLTEHHDLVYVPPVTRIEQHTVSAASSTASHQPDLGPVFIAPVNIPTSIPSVPTINTDATINVEELMRRSALSGSGRATGAQSDGGYGASGNATFNENQVDKAIIELPGNPQPRYPESLRNAGVEDTVVATYIVDATGRVEKESLEFPSTTRAPFVASIRDALMKARFRPAEVAGHAVRQRVTQPFIFTLTK